VRTDTQVIHSDDIGEVVGSFYGVPINSLNPIASELRELDDAQVRARAGLGTEPSLAEVLPGEVAKDNLIRRETTAEVVGETFYAEDIPKGRQVPISEVPDGVLVTWRPNNLEFAVIHEEVTDEISTQGR
jgi:hypothetical protein